MAPGLEAQNLEGIAHQKALGLSGSITARVIMYGANGIEDHRKPFSYMITGNPTISIYNSFTIPLSFTYSEQDRSFRQPFNQFGMSPYYKWLTIHAGYRNINFSQFTLAGHTFLGGGVELHPGIFRFGFIAGRFNRATPVDTTSKSMQPFIFANRGFGAKIGLGKGSTFFDLSFLKAKDDSSSVKNEGKFRGTVTPAENIVVGINGQVRFLKNFTLSVEAATSLYTRNLGLLKPLANDADKGITKILGNFIHTNNSTERYNAIQAALAFQQKIFSMRIQYRRVDPDYKTMGAYFFNSDLENITASPSLNLLKNKLRFSGSIGFQHDNLNKQKQATSNRIIGSANLSAEFSDHFGIDMNYNNYSNTQMRKTVLLQDSFRIAQVSQNFAFTPRYILANDKFIHSVVLSANYNVFTSVDKSVDNLNDTKSYNYFLNYQITLVPHNLSFTVNLNYTHVQSSSYEDGNYGITGGINKVFDNSKLTTGWTGSFLKGTNSKTTGLILNQTVNVNYRINKHHNFGLNVNYINNKSQQTEFTPSYSEWKADINYRFAF